MPAQHLSPKEFAELSGLSLATVHRYLRGGKLPHAQPAGPRGRILIPADALCRPASPAPANAGPTAAASLRGTAPAGPDGRPGPAPAWLRGQTR